MSDSRTSDSEFGDEMKEIWRAVIRNGIEEPKWREIMVSARAKSSCADDLIGSLMDHADKVANESPGLQSLFTEVRDLAEMAWSWVESNTRYQAVAVAGRKGGQAFLRSFVLARNAPLRFGLRTLLGPADLEQGESIGLDDNDYLESLNSARIFTVELARALCIDLSELIGFEPNCFDIADFIFHQKTHPGRSLEMLGALYSDYLKDRNLNLCLEIGNYRRDGDPNIYYCLSNILVEYCSTCSLICECKRASRDISTQAWEGVCARMLTPC